MIYVRSYADCSSLYMVIKCSLGSYITDPPGCPNVKGHRLVDMFTRVLSVSKKEDVLNSFTSVDSTLRLVIATTAFGMGIDCPDIRTIIHWGMPSSVEEYTVKKKCGEHTKTVAYSTLFQKSVLYATVLVCPPHFFSIIFYSVCTRNWA